MGDAEDLRQNEESVARMVGRTIVEAEVSTGRYERAMGVSLKLDDGSRIYIDGLRPVGVEVGYVSPEEAFEIDRTAMEEGAYRDREP
jgi:hypothetical protein